MSASINPDHAARPYWKHRQGHAYQPVTHYAQMVPGSPPWWATDRLGEPVGTIDVAWRIGWRETGTDDFNIAVISDDRVIGWLWHREIVDDDPKFLDEMTKELCRGPV